MYFILQVSFHGYLLLRCYFRVLNVFLKFYGRFGKARNERNRAGIERLEVEKIRNSQPMREC